MAVDFARVTFTRPFRFFRDSDTEVTVKWYRAAPDAKVLPHASVYSLDLFREDNYQQRPVGEVIADKPAWIDPRDRPPNALGQHLCDTPLDWWIEGQPIQPGREPLTRDGWGIPLCCTGFILGGPGGVLLGGAGDVTRLVASVGGLMLDGSGTSAVTVTSTGGLMLDGSGDATATAVSDGGLSLDGSGDATATAVSDGGLSLDGSGDVGLLAGVGGGLSLDGSGDVYSPATPGSLCSVATDGGETGRYTIWLLASRSVKWMKHSLLGGHTYRFEWIFKNGGAVSFTLGHGSCPAPTTDGTVSLGSHIDVSPSVNTDYFVQLGPDAAVNTSVAYSVIRLT